MGSLLNSIHSEILGHENALKYLSSQGFKGELKDQPELLLSSLKYMRNCFTRLHHLAGCSLLNGDVTFATCWFSCLIWLFRVQGELDTSNLRSTS